MDETKMKKNLFIYIYFKYDSCLRPTTNSENYDEKRFLINFLLELLFFS